MWLHIVKWRAFRLNRITTLTLNRKSKTQQKKLKTIRGSYTDLDLSIHAKKGPKKSRETLPLSDDRYIIAYFLFTWSKILLFFEKFHPHKRV
jgi:hypothetical protein